MRVIWNGDLQFGKLNVPVGLYSGASSNDLDFDLIVEDEEHQVGYQKVDKETGEEVDDDEITRAYEIQDGKYVPIEEEVFEAADPEATQTIEILDFVDPAEVPPMFIDRPYYLEPDGSDKAYALVREAVRKSEKVGIATVVLRSRKRLAMLLEWEDVLVLNLLRFENELRSPGDFDVPGDDLDDLEISDEELEKAQDLIEEMTADWDPSNYEDDYREKLLEAIEEKAEEGEVTVVDEAAARRAEEREEAEEAEDFTEELEESLEEAS